MRKLLTVEYVSPDHNPFRFVLRSTPIVHSCLLLTALLLGSIRSMNDALLASRVLDCPPPLQTPRSLD